MQSKDKSNSNSSTRKSIRFDNKLLNIINEKRGSVPFGTWVQDVCAQAVKSNSNPVCTEENKPVRTPADKKTKLSVNSYADEHDLPGNITKELHEQIMELSNQGLSSRKIAEIVLVSKATVNRTLKSTQK